VGIKALPPLQRGEEYHCLFGFNSSATPGRVAPNEVRCQTPVISSLPVGEGEMTKLVWPVACEVNNLVRFIRCKTSVPFRAVKTLAKTDV